MISGENYISPLSLVGVTGPAHNRYDAPEIYQSNCLKVLPLFTQIMSQMIQTVDGIIALAGEPGFHPR